MVLVKHALEPLRVKPGYVHVLHAHATFDVGRS
jgi:hypothetical protein